MIQVILKSGFNIFIRHIAKAALAPVRIICKISTDMCLSVAGRKKPVFIKNTCLVKNGRIICFGIDSGIINIRIPAQVSIICKRGWIE